MYIYLLKRAISKCDENKLKQCINAIVQFTISQVNLSMKSELLLVMLLFLFGSTIAQTETKKQLVSKEDYIIEEFLFTIDPESTEVDIKRISSRLHDIGINHRLKILSYTSDNKIGSIEFRRILHDGSDGLGCIVCKLKKFTLYTYKESLACKSE